MASCHRHPNYIFGGIGGLIFFSILFSASGWSEYFIIAAIFALGGWLVLVQNGAANSETKQLLAPVCVLAFYSFAQGAATLLADRGAFRIAAALPGGFDAAASFWCGVKFLALAIFLKILLVDFRGCHRLIVWSLISVGNFFAVLGIARFFLQAGLPDVFGWFILPELRPGIGFGTHFNQNHFAFLMLLNLGLNGGLAAFGGLAKDRRRLLSIFSVLTWTAIVLTASRGGIISSFVVVLWLVFALFAGFKENKARATNKDFRLKVFSLGKKTATAGALLGLLIVGVALIGQDRVLQRFEEIPAQFETAGDAEGFRRIDVWRATAVMIDEHRLYGVGFGGFRRAVSQYADISGVIEPRDAHNDYLELAASGGLIAVLCAAWLAIIFSAIVRKRCAAPHAPFEAAVRTGAFAAFAGIAVHSLFDSGLQIVGNWLFCAALLSVAVGSEAAENDPENASRRRLFDVPGGKFLRIVFYTILILSCLLFGYAQLENARATHAGADCSAARNLLPRNWFDADSHAARATLCVRASDFERAAEHIEAAIALRPNDYALRLRAAKIQAARGQTAAAENEFQQAIRLAPRYAEPHFAYGEFLAAHNREIEGFEKMRFAFERNPPLFDAAVALAWRASGENADATARLLSPLGAPEKSWFAAFLLDKNQFAAAADLMCRAEDSDERQRADLIQRLFEKRQYRQAFRIDRRDCDPAPRAALSDGDFETGELREHFGFGWRVGNLPDAVNISFDREATAASGRASLRVTFDGDADASLPLVSQMIVVEKNRRYQFSFASRAEKITSGGVPVVQLIFKQTNAPDALFKSIKLPENGGWTRVSIVIETGKQTEALEIRLTRQSCNQRLCPIFGRLWLDNFILSSE